MAHRNLTIAAGRGLSCSKAAGAQTNPLEHHICGHPGNGEEPVKMCCGDKKPAKGGAIFQFLFFFVTSRDNLESMMGRYGTSFIHHFSVYLVSTSVYIY